MGVGGQPLVDRTIRWLRHLVGTTAATIVSRQIQYITLKRLDIADAGAASVLPADATTECLVVESVEAFDAVAPAIPGSFRDAAAELRARIAGGCVVTLARRGRPDGRGFQVIGYEIAERGVFSALGRRMRTAGDVVFSHYVEVLPACRGQRVHQRLFAARDAYFRARGGRVVCGVCDPDNRASLRALAREGAVIVGTVERIVLLRAFVLRYASVPCPGHTLDTCLSAARSAAHCPGPCPCCTRPS
jgi:GNAT superfamily N-acetyltransferase